MMPNGNQKHNWNILLIGGNSGSGKTTLARELSRHFDVPWLQVDDFRLVLQHNTSADARPELHHFDDLSTVYRNPPEVLSEWRVATAEATSAAIEVVIANHTTFGGPAILEGDDIVPALAPRDEFAGTTVEVHAVRAVFLIETDEEAIADNIRRRGREVGHRSAGEELSQVQMNSLYGTWLQQEAQRYGLSVVTPRPWHSLLDRAFAVIG
jgi:2-phosphoglycerate kinase